MQIREENKASSRLYIKVWKYLLICSLLVLMITVIINRSSEVENLALLPLAHIIYMLFARKTYRRQPGLALLIIQTVMVCRFLVIPLMYAFNSTYTGVLVDSSYLSVAVWIMFYEEIMVGAMMHLWTSIAHRDKPVYLSVYTENRYIRPLTLLIILFWFFIISVNAKLRGYLFNFSLLTRSEMGFEQYISLGEYQADIPGLFKVFFHIGLVVLFTTVVQFIAKSHLFKFVKFLLLAFVCTGFISSMWSSGFSVSRWGMLIATILSAYVLLYVFPNRKKTVLIIGIIAAVSVVLLGSVLKTVAMGNTNTSVQSTIEKYLNVEAFDEYFEGIAPVANGLLTAKLYASDRGIEGIFLDCFYNFPYAMRILGISDTHVATYYFHLTTKHYDLIMPTVTQSVMQFGMFLAPIYSCVLVWLALWFDRKQQAATTLYRKLFYTALVFWTSLFMAVSTNVIEANIWHAVIGIWLIVIEEIVTTKVKGVRISGRNNVRIKVS